MPLFVDFLLLVIIFSTSKNSSSSMLSNVSSNESSVSFFEYLIALEGDHGLDDGAMFAILGKVPKKNVFFGTLFQTMDRWGVQSPKLFSENNHSVIFTYL